MLLQFYSSQHYQTWTENNDSYQWQCCIKLSPVRRSASATQVRMYVCMGEHTSNGMIWTYLDATTLWSFCSITSKDNWDHILDRTYIFMSEKAIFNNKNIHHMPLCSTCYSFLIETLFNFTISSWRCLFFLLIRNHS